MRKPDVRIFLVRSANKSDAMHILWLLRNLLWKEPVDGVSVFLARLPAMPQNAGCRW